MTWSTRGLLPRSGQSTRSPAARSPGSATTRSGTSSGRPWSRPCARIAACFPSLRRGCGISPGACNSKASAGLPCLGGRKLAGKDAARLAESVDLAAVLTLDRVLEQVLGPGASARDPRTNEAAAPWLAGLKLGSRIHLVQELLRLLPPGEITGAC